MNNPSDRFFLVPPCLRISLGLGLATAMSTLLAAPGDLVPGFPVGDGPDQNVYQAVVQTDGKIVVGGDFANWGALKRRGIARVAADGNLDAAFNAGDGFNGGVYAVAIQSDDKILAGGSFSTYGGDARAKLARLKADGTIDAPFPSLSINSDVYAIVATPGGDIYIGGAFTSVAGQTRNYLARIKSDGTLDAGFNPGLNNVVYSMARQSDGKILLGGEFSAAGSVLRRRILRLNADGSLDASFDPGAGPDGGVRSLAVAADGGIVMGGQFGAVNGLGRRYLARLGPTGLPDATFNAQVDYTVWAIAIQPDGRILIGGEFGSVGGTSRPRIARLRADGILDPTFVTPSGADGAVRAFGVEQQGSVVVAGQFGKLGGVNRRFLGRVAGLGSAAGGELEFSSVRYSVNESLPSVTLEVRRLGNTGPAVTVGFSTANGTATAGDYVPQVGGTLSFASGESKKTIAISIKPDSLAEDSETFTVTLENPSGGAVLGATPSTTVTIENDDPSDRVGSVDTQFLGRLGIEGGLYAHASLIQPDGKIVIAGNFFSANDIGRARIARFRPDGTLDSAFNAATWFDGPIYTLARQNDDRILVGGGFNVANGVNRYKVARLNADGTLDASFNPGSGPNGDVYSILAYANGDILIGGEYGAYAGQPNSSYLVRVFSDGTLDPTFKPGMNGNVFNMTFDKNGGLLMGGNFTVVAAVPRNRVARLMPNGTLDPAFDPGAGANYQVRRVVPLPDGGVFVTGDFNYYNGLQRNGMARLMPDGTCDPRFVANANGSVYSAILQPDGQMIVAGRFDQISGQPQRHLARLRTDGSIDTAFDIGTGANADIYTIAQQSDQNLIIGGAFTAFNDYARPGMARIQVANTAAGGVIEFVSATYRVSEASPSATIQVRRSGNSGQQVTVKYIGANGTATGGDYVAPSGTLTFLPGETAKSFSVTIKSDSNVEDDETVLLSLNTPGNGAVLGSQAAAVLTIENDDSAPDAGTLDGTFHSRFDDWAYTLHVYPDDSMIVVGNFSRVGDANRVRIARVDPDGVPLPGFNPAAWTDGIIYGLAVQDDGRILIGGDFGIVNGQRRTRIARLNDDGTLDETFNPGVGPNGSVFVLRHNPATGDVLVGGGFSAMNNDFSYGYLARLYSDGTQDTSFQPRVNGAVVEVVQTSGGKILIGGDFTSVGGVYRARMARLLPDGPLDTAFDTAGGFNGTVRAMLPLADGSILVGGNFYNVNGFATSYMVRLRPDGLPDPSYVGRFNYYINSIVPQADGKFVVSGDFTQIDSVPFGRIARLLPDLTIDPSFDMHLGANGVVWETAPQLDGSIIAIGNFTTFNGLPRERFVRLSGLSAAAGGELEFTTTRYLVDEGAGSVVVEVRRNGNRSAAVTVDYATSNGSATAADYTTQSGKLIFGVNESKKSFSVPIKQDSLLEDAETILVTLSNPTGSAILGGSRKATIYILNDDRPTDFGSVDADGVSGANGEVNDIVVQADGKWLVGGEFSAVAGVGRIRLARLNANGSIDTSFNPGTWFDGRIYAIAIQSDGRIVVGGSFQNVNGVRRNRLARLYSDGTLDVSFDPGVGPNGDVYALLMLPGDEIIVGGGFSAFNNVGSQAYLTRLLSDGTVAQGFSAGMDNYVVTAVLAGADRIVIGGGFSNVGGKSRARVARIGLNGALDATFDPGTGANGEVRTVRVLPDQKMLIGGAFWQYGGKTAQYIARIGNDGVLDTGFKALASLNATVFSLAVQSDGRIVATGDFTTFNGVAQNRVIRMNADGTLDPSLAIGTGANGRVWRGVPHPDGHLILGGAFGTFNDLNRPNLVQVFSTPPTNVKGPSIQSIELVTANQVVLTVTGTAGQKFKLQSALSLTSSWTESAPTTLTGPSLEVPQLIPQGVKILFFRVVQVP